MNTVAFAYRSGVHQLVLVMGIAVPCLKCAYLRGNRKGCLGLKFSVPVYYDVTFSAADTISIANKTY